MALLPTEAAKLSNDVLRLRTPVHHRQSRARPPSSPPHPRRDPATLPPRCRHASDPRRRASKVAGGAREAPPLAHPSPATGSYAKVSESGKVSSHFKCNTCCWKTSAGVQ